MERPWELIDIHAHVNFNAFKDDGKETIQRAHDAGVGMILVGSQYETSERAVRMAEEYAHGVWAAVGLHPIHLTEFHVDAKEIGTDNVPGFTTRVEEFSEEKYRALATSPTVVAVGECGLDYYRVESSPEKKKLQHDIFARHIALARELKKPLIVHCREAYVDLLGILKSEHGEAVGGTIHFFAGDWETAKQFIDIGFHLSFTGVITFADQYDEVVKNMPLDRLMVETDAPYVAPVPHRGKRNEPAYVKEIAQRVAAIRGISYEDVARATTENAQKLFRL